MTVVVAVLVIAGLAFSVSGAVGILRMPDVYCRIQCSSKTVTMGMIPLLIALVVAEGPMSNYGGRALLVAALTLVMSPMASHALGRAAYKAGVPMWSGAVLDEARSQGEGGTEAQPAAAGREPDGSAGSESGSDASGSDRPGSDNPGSGSSGPGAR